MNTLERSIASHPFTKDLNPRYLHLLIGCATYEQFGPRQEIFHEGFTADRFFLIHSGSVALQTFLPGRGVITVETLNGGNILGWSWLFPPNLWRFTATTVEPTEAAVLSAQSLRDEMEENHDFGYEVFSRICQSVTERLQVTRQRMLELLCTPD